MRVGGVESDTNGTYELLQAAIDAVGSVPESKGIGIFVLGTRGKFAGFT